MNLNRYPQELGVLSLSTFGGTTTINKEKIKWCHHWLREKRQLRVLPFLVKPEHEYASAERSGFYQKNERTLQLS